VQEALIRAACTADLDDSRMGRYLTTIVVDLCADHGRTRFAARRALAGSTT
jgi:hypothetical protein